MSAPQSKKRVLLWLLEAKNKENTTKKSSITRKIII